MKLGTRFHLPYEREANKVRYIVAWIPGVPGVLILIWFVMSHH